MIESEQEKLIPVHAIACSSSDVSNKEDPPPRSVAVRVCDHIKVFAMLTVVCVVIAMVRRLASATPPSLASCDQAIGARADVCGIERRAKRCRSGRSERPLATKQHAVRLGDAKRTATIVHTTPIYSLPLVFTTSPRHRPPVRAPHADIDPRCAHPVFNVGSASRRARRRGPARSGPFLAQRPARRHRAASRQSPCAGNLETPA